MIRCREIYVLFILWTVTDAQFLYNYEQEAHGSEEPESYNPTEYKYNSPSAVEHHFLRTSRDSSPRTEQPEPRAYDVQPNNAPIPRPKRRQKAPRNYRPQPEPIIEEHESEYHQPPPEYVSEVPAEYVPDERPVRQSRKRQSRIPRVETVEPPKYYGPSAFDNIPLGQPPAGIYVPHDSLLNLIKEDRSQRSQHQAIATERYAPESNNFDSPAQPPVQSVSVYRPEPYFVTPPPFLQQRSHVQPVNHIPQQPRNIPVPTHREEPVEYIEEPQPQPRHIPSSQEIQQNEYRRQRRVQQPPPAHQPQPQPQPRPQPRPQRRSRQQVRPAPRPVFRSEEPPQQVNQVDPTPEEYPDDIRRSQPRRSQGISQQTRRQQVSAVAAAPNRKRQPTFKPANLAIAALPDDSDDDGIPGAAGVDYPTLHVIPSTSFSCARQSHNGYYADLETSCQVMHLCQEGGVQDSFLCPNGTIFSQEKFSCQWWYKVNCQNSPRYYSINDQLYKLPENTKNKN